MGRIGNTLYNVINDKDGGSNNTYNKATTYYDGVTLLDDTKVDNGNYIKVGNEYFINNSFLFNKEIDLRAYGLIGDEELHSISDLLPNVTLAQVQSIDNEATLSNSAAWYIISMLLKTLPVQSTILISGGYAIDREIKVSRGFIKFKGINSNKANKFLNHRSKIIQKGNGMDIFRVIDGDGSTYGYGTGHVDFVFFDNLIVEGTMTATNLSGDGFSFHLSPEGIAGTAINWVFNDVQVRSCRNGFNHVTGHINDFYFTRCDFSMNFNAGFVTNGNPQNQPNNFNFNCTGFSANGYKIENGTLVDFVQDTAAKDYTKGGCICKQIVAFSFVGCNAQSNKGYGFDLGDGAHLGVLINGYSENNTLADLRLLKDAVHNRDVKLLGFYSRDQLIEVEDPIVEASLFGSAGSIWELKNGNAVSLNDTRNVGIGAQFSNDPIEKLDVSTLQPITRIRVGYGSSINGVALGWDNDGGRGEVKTNLPGFPIEVVIGAKRQLAVKEAGVVVGETPIYFGHVPPPNGVLSEGGYASELEGIIDATDDASAAAANVAVGRFYRTGNVLKIRIA